jgi:hypothetical protein
MITVQNIEKVTKILINKAAEMRQIVSSQIITIGNQTVQDLQLRFPDLTFTGQFFSDKMEYWITIYQLGEKLTEIKCPQSNLFFRRKREDDGTQQFRSDGPEFEETWIQEIADLLSLQLNSIVGRK